MERVVCRDVAQRLNRRMDGLLSAVEVSALDEHLAACADCRGQADRLDWVASVLRRPGRATPGFSDRVLRRVRAEGTSRAAREVTPRLGAWALLPAAAAFIIVAGLAVRGFMNPPAVVVDRPVEPPRVQVELELAKVDARSVAVAGDFNEWQAEGSRMVRGSDGVWRIRLELPPGRYQYAFVIDGEQWIADPQASTVVDSGFSGTNSVLDVSL